MAQKNKPTSNEHFIPQCYLKQFSYDNKHIYQFDIKSGKATPKPVSTDSICYQKNLYEFRDESGSFIYRNLIENQLCKLEIVYSRIIKSIKSKTACKKNYKTHSFLTKKEKMFLIYFIMIQQMRGPFIINETEREIGTKWGDILDKCYVRNLTIMSLLPIYKKLFQTDNNIIFSKLHLFDEMSYLIGTTDNDSIFTSDNPVIMLWDDKLANLEEVIYPLSSRIILYMKPHNQTPKGFRNRMIHLESKDIEYINKVIVKLCKRWVYSKNALTESQIKWIMKERGG